MGKFLIGVKMVAIAPAKSENDPPPAESPEPPLFQIGDQVKFKRGESWNLGTIKSINDNGTFDCWYSKEEGLSGYAPERTIEQIIKLDNGSSNGHRKFGNRDG